MVSFDIHPLLTHIHTVFLIVLVKIVKMAVNTEGGTYWQHHPQSRWRDKAEVTTPCTWVHVGREPRPTHKKETMQGKRASHRRARPPLRNSAQLAGRRACAQSLCLFHSLILA